MSRKVPYFKNMHRVSNFSNLEISATQNIATLKVVFLSDGKSTK